MMITALPPAWLPVTTAACVHGDTVCVKGEWEPRCGRDRVTYANLCLARNACQGDATEGPCRSVTPPLQTAERAEARDEAVTSADLHNSAAPGAAHAAPTLTSHRRYQAVPGINDPLNWRKLDEWLANDVAIAGVRIKVRWLASIVLVVIVALLGLLASLQDGAAWAVHCTLTLYIVQP